MQTPRHPSQPTHHDSIRAGDLTWSQGMDLLRWLAPNPNRMGGTAHSLLHSSAEHVALFCDTNLIAYGSDRDHMGCIENALRNAELWPGPDVAPPPPKFTAIGMQILRGSDSIARAISSTMARRIANALNRYQPNSRGC